MKSGVFLVAFCARLKTYGAFFGDKNHKAFSRFCLCGHEKSGLGELALAPSGKSIDLKVNDLRQLVVIPGFKQPPKGDAVTFPVEQS
ncbi:hypothetical protein ACG745_05025 [Pseudomonas aeruginosa]|uniref:hypothetical protein n=1 Tax=Pseudomonas aeruginosa TaxID=287 RepID=UPI00375394E3